VHVLSFLNAKHNEKKLNERIFVMYLSRWFWILHSSVCPQFFAVSYAYGRSSINCLLSVLWIYELFTISVVIAYNRIDGVMLAWLKLVCVCVLYSRFCLQVNAVWNIIVVVCIVVLKCSTIYLLLKSIE